MQLLPGDYVLCGLTLVMAVTGLFRGFSGTLAFVLATVAAGGVGILGWPYSASFTSALWMRGAGTLVAVLLVFGLVRLIVKKLVNGLLAQPSDALFGALVGALVGLLLLGLWAYTGFHVELSRLAQELAPYVR